jgi:hypothetical protein
VFAGLILRRFFRALIAMRVARSAIEIPIAAAVAAGDKYFAIFRIIDMA